ncbi:universal stress protein [Streptomyces jumonjinensis]|uniref:universal stress protein n=1 Tax=Streptomyces jumonjinensis TaxID=1945 RepID=UPI003794B992
MSRTVTVGLDGSRESLAAAEWAAREAKLRGLPLRLVNVWEPLPLFQAPFMGAETEQDWTRQIPREAAEELGRRHPGLDVTWEQLTGRPAEVLAEAAETADLLVLGSEGLSTIGGFLVGSVGQAVVARAERPVVVVRALAQDDAGAGADIAESGGEQPVPDGPVVLGLDANAPDDALIAFAFEAAARRETELRVVHSWSLPPYFAYGLPPDPQLDAQLAETEATALTEALRPWRQKHPSVAVVEDSRPGKTVDQLVAASHGAALLVVGRRIRRATPFGGRIGSVAHAVLHHATAPVAVIPHQ